MATNLLHGAHRIEGASDHLRGARAIHLIARFRFEKLRVREDDSKLIVEAVKEEPQFGRWVHRTPREQFFGRERTVDGQARVRPSASHTVSTAG